MRERRWGGGDERTSKLSGPGCLHAVVASRRLSFVMQGGWEGQNKAMRNSQQRTTQSRKLWSSTVLHISSPLSSAASFASHFASVRPNRCPAPWPARYRLRPHRRFSSSFGQLALVGTLDVWPLRGTAVSCTPHQTATIRALALALCLCSCDHKSHYQARADHVPVLLERDLR